MSVHDAEPCDIYVDKQGKLWRCIGVNKDPTVLFEEVEGRTPDPPSPYNNVVSSQAINSNGYPPKVEIIKTRLNGGVGGLMWEGWKRIYRP